MRRWRMALAALVKMHGHVEAVQVKVAKRSSNWVRTPVLLLPLRMPFCFRKLAPT